MTENRFFATLPRRGLIRVSGPDRRSFLQGIISNDMTALDHTSCLYACLLTPQGKFLHDFFITESSDLQETHLECEGGVRAQDLYRRLDLYRLRARVTLMIEEEIPVFVTWEATENFALYPDPRHQLMGFRSVQKPEGFEEKPFSFWDERRIRLVIPDGSRDMDVEKSTLIECNIDKLNGVSWEKGCYIGQELTARMHYRGLAKKHLYAVESDLPLPTFGTEIKSGERVIGHMCSSAGRIGLALLKDEHAAALSQENALRLLPVQAP